ncbi:MAG TPA: AAA family ATPase [Bacillota bacterium]|nr:AAA family ATPase [Bacillota bacterium]
MKIVSAHVYGFGQLVDYKITLKNDELICIYGENEAGKSTVYQFVLYVLFGLSTRESKRYVPKKNATLGGMLTVETKEDGLINIVRQQHIKNGDAICYSRTGEEKSDDWLRQQLNGLTRTTFESIYSFTAEDLKHVRSIKQEELSELLFSVSVSGSKNVYDVEKRLINQMDKLFKRQGSVPLINKQLKDLEQMAANVAKKETYEATYKEKNDALMTLTDTFKNKEKRLAVVETKKNQLTRHLQLLPRVNQFKQLNERLLSYDQEMTFPENGVERYELLKEKVIPLQSKLQFYEEQLKLEEEQRTKIENSLLTSEEEQLLTTLLDTLNKTQHIEETRDRLATDLFTAETTLQADLEQLQLSLTIEDINDIHLPFHLAEDWRSLIDESTDIKREEERLSEALRLKKDEQMQTINQLYDLEEQMLPEEEKVAHKQFLSDFSLKQAEQNLSAKQFERLEKNNNKQKKLMRNVLNGLLFISAISMSLGLILSNQIFYIVAILSIIGGASQYVWQKFSEKQWKELMSDSREPFDASMEEKRQVIESALLEQEERQVLYATLENTLEQIDIALDEYNYLISTIQQKKQTLNDKKETYEDQYSFLENIKMSYWMDVYDILKESSRKWQKVLNLREKRTELVTELHLYEDEINAVKSKLNHLLNETDDESLIQTIEMIQREEDYNKKVQVDNQQVIQSYERKRTLLLNEKRMYEADIKQLFDYARVTTEEQYYSCSNAWSNMQNDIEQKKQMEKELNEIDAEWQDLLVESLDSLRREETYEKATKESEQLEQELEELREQIASSQAEINHIERANNFTHDNYTLEISREQLRREALKWSAYKVAYDTLKKAMYTYQENYLTGVISLTEKYFRKVTENKYVKIIPPKNKKGFQVKSNESIVYDVQQLSKGTIDLLYICLRLAIGEQMSDTFAVPYLMDDTFVHFDNKRSERAMQLVNELSDNKQIILFSCHETFLDTMPNGRVIKMKRN